MLYIDAEEGDNHVHKLEINTDFFAAHFHEIEETTGPAIPVGDGKHIHFIKGKTSEDANHKHKFVFATLIENPIG